jgi:glucose/arabinose dehydrogenase
VTEFTSADGGATASVASARVIIEVYQPAGNHNGGHIAFGPDGYLYIGRGDGGGSGDDWGSIGNGQRLSTLLGKLLRIDVNGTTGATPYAIPAGNPFPGSVLCNNDTGAFAHNCPEIYAYGLRNPWRWSFDTGSGQLWLADVGQGAWEEVNRVVAGGNYGWRCMEGTLPTSLVCGNPSTPLLPPVAEYEHPLGQAVTGGYVYRGTAIPALVGRYVFADYSSQLIWNIPADTAPTRTMSAADASDSNANITSFAEDANGELYVVDVRTAAIYRIVAGT